MPGSRKLVLGIGEHPWNAGQHHDVSLDTSLNRGDKTERDKDHYNY